MEKGDKFMTVSTKTKLLDKLYEICELFKECITDETLKAEILSKTAQIYWLLFNAEITEQYRSEKPSVVDMLNGKASTEHVPAKIVNVVGAETRR